MSKNPEDFDERFIDKEVIKLDLADKAKISLRESTSEQLSRLLLDAKKSFALWLSAKYSIAAMRKKPLFISSEALKQTLNLSNVKPPVTDEQLDGVVFSVSPGGVAKEENGFQIQNPETAYHESKNFPKNLILQFMRSLDQEEFLLSEVAKGSSYSTSIAKTYLEDLIEEKKVKYGSKKLSELNGQLMKTYKLNV